MDNERLDAEVLISGRPAMNRGMDSDIVAIEILPKARLQASVSHLLLRVAGTASASSQLFADQLPVKPVPLHVYGLSRCHSLVDALLGKVRPLHAALCIRTLSRLSGAASSTSQRLLRIAGPVEGAQQRAAHSATAGH